MAGYIGTQAVSVNTTSATISDDLAVGDDATITGDLDVDGTTNLDVVDIDGAVDMASTLTVTGAAHFGADVDLVQAKHIRFKHQAGGTIRASISAESNDNLQLNTGSSETARMTIDTNGNVGIGTAVQVDGSSAMNHPLTLAAASNGNLFALNRGTGGLFNSFMSTTGQVGIAATGSNGRLEFRTGTTVGTSTIRMTVESAGDVTIEGGNLVIGTAGKGIDFSAQASANSVTGVSTTAELLNHYERGTWTPGFEDNAGNAYDLSGFSNFKGQYVRIGDFVFLSFFVNDTGTLSGNTSFLKVTGLPFNIVNTLGNLTAGAVYTFGGFTGLGADDTLIFRTQVNSATAFVQVVSGGTGRNVTQADFGGAMSTAFTFSYRCI